MDNQFIQYFLYQMMVGDSRRPRFRILTVSSAA